EAYLDLLKRVLTNTLFAEEPGLRSADEEMDFVRDFIGHYINGPAISMLPTARLDNLRFCVEDVLARGVAGDVIETGVWRGGGCIYMRAILKAHGIPDGTVGVADSFEGLPTPDADRFPLEAAVHSGPVMRKAYRHFAASLDLVRKHFAAFGL